MSYATIADRRVSSASFSFPYYGIWVADLMMPSEEALPSGILDIVSGSMRLRGTVVRQGSIAGDRTARIVGGAAGWARDVPAASYANASGVALATILGDVAREVGETLTGVDSSDASRRHYVRANDCASRVLRELVGGLWYVRPDGITSLATRDGSAIASPFQVVARNGATGRIEIATEHPEDWMPGRTFASVTVPELQTIGYTSVVSDDAGKLRVEVLTL